MASVRVYDEFFLFSHLTVLLLLLFLTGNGNGQHDVCPNSFDCGSLGKICHPFTKAERQDCSALAIHGCDDLNKTSVKSVQLISGGKLFPVTKVQVDLYYSTGNTISFINKDFSKLLQGQNACEVFSSYNNIITLPPPSPFGYFYIKGNITAFKCNHTHKLVKTRLNVFKNSSCPHYDFYFGPPIPDDESRRSLASCSVFHLSVIEGSALSGNPFPYLTDEITIEFQSSDYCRQCYLNRGGRCRRLQSNGNIYCATTKGRTRSLTWKLGLALALVAVGVAVLIVLACRFGTKILPSAFLLFRKENPTHRIIEEFLKEHGPLPARYRYSDVKKITNSFKNKLGRGGYGSVYKGKLYDGRIVAVKVLGESKGNGEDFINEVASISRTSHVNIVRLLGFCLDGSKKALLYEFMPNGSLEKFIYEEKNTSREDHQLDSKTLYDIAVGVARGLEYLHRGCNTRILHFDIKPHNILLDEDFCPKISDFGLARICQRKESIVSTFGARGTAGYIAPELFFRNFGRVSHKSDVYSYGMMVLEMVGQRKNIKVEVDCSSELYFPQWIYKRLELNQELGLRSIENEIDEETVRKMTVVSLWCIQTDPSNRPAMHKVVEMLEGSLQDLEIPPKPFLSSPSTSLAHLSTESL